MSYKVNTGLIVVLLLFFISCKYQSKDFITDWQTMHASKQDELKGFDSLKYGMFIHWGLYSVPGGIWEGKRLEEFGRRPNVAEWIQYIAQIPRSEYVKLAEEFNPVRFNADSIVQLAKDAGMKYLVITSKHHDGFAMYHSKVSKFNIVDATPFKRDVIEELYESCKKNGIRFGLYYSHARDWADDGDSQYSAILEMNRQQGNVRSKGKRLESPWGANTWDPKPVSYDDYLKNKALPQVKELLRKFPDLLVLWYDASTYMLPEQSFAFYELPFKMQPKVLINNRVGPGIHYIDEDDYDFGDYNSRGDNVILKESVQFTNWETCGTTNNSWGYRSYDKDFKTVREQLWWLVEVVSRGGNYLLNVGPTGEGIVPEHSAAILREVGEWLKYNGDAIYNTKRWTVQKEGPTVFGYRGTTDRGKRKFQSSFTAEDFWFTSRDQKVYAIAFEYPADNMARIKSLKKDRGTYISSVKLLSTKEPLDYQQTDQGLLVELPQGKRPDTGYVLEVDLGI